MELSKKMMEEFYGDLFKRPIDNKRRVVVHCWPGGYDLFCKLIQEEFGQENQSSNKEDLKAVQEERDNKTIN